MQKLKLYGIKDEKEEQKDSKHVATVYVDENKKVVVEAEDNEVKQDLLDAIYDPEAPDEPPVFIRKGSAPTEELRQKEKEQGVRSLWMTSVRPGDPHFLRCLRDAICTFRRKYGDYYIFWHEIVEE